MVRIKKVGFLASALVLCLLVFGGDRVDSVSYCDAIPVITYHDIGDAKNPYTIKPHEFENQIKYLVQQGYTFLVPGDIHLFMHNKKKFPKKSVMITFDDGYKGVYTYGYPILKKYKVRVTLFVVCMFIERESFITFANLDEMVGSGMFFIGSHTYDSHHTYYYPKENKTLPDTFRQIGESEPAYQARILSDLTMSKEMLELMYPQLLINTFAYPFGEYNKELIQQVKKAGFTFAFAYNSDKQMLLTHQSNPFTLERYPVFPGTAPNKLCK
jgi:peptidoglycan/xylan/chitin deacetylase (PgdA/CDA1 family)